MQEVKAETPAAIAAVRAMFEAVAAKPRRMETVEVPELGIVHVRALSAKEYDEFEAACAKADSPIANRALLVRHCVVTPDGQKVFRDDHIEMIEGLGINVVGPIAKKALVICGASKEESEAIAKNSEAPRGEG